MTEPRRIAAEVDAAEALELRKAHARVLAIGSQLVHGSVGLNAAEQVYAGEDMRAIRVPSVVLSVMPHYPSVHQVDVDARWIRATLADLEAIGATSSLELVTAGYLMSADQAEALAIWIAKESLDARPTFVLDPTLGDVEVGFYTDPTLVHGFRDHLIPLATGLTPNLFELAHLTGTDIASLTDLVSIERAARSLMREHTEWIVVTGIELDGPAPGDTQSGGLQAGDANRDASSNRTAAGSERGQTSAAGIGELVVTREGARLHRHERLDTVAKGLGDTFTAMLNVALVRGETLDNAVDLAAAEVRRRAR